MVSSILPFVQTYQRPDALARPTTDAVLDALGDPTRRAIFRSLRGGSLAVGQIASEMPVSRPAVSQHLRVLKAAGLVTDRAEGTRRLYRIDPSGLAVLRRELESYWDDVLAAFAAEADRAGSDTARTKRHAAGTAGREDER
jgi:DNA-binding transcriptional ArsR family regulator